MKARHRWIIGGCAALAALCLVLALVVVRSADERQSRDADRIDHLSDQLAEQQTTIEALRAQAAANNVALAALAEQVRQLGGNPVASPAPESSGASSETPTTTVTPCVVTLLGVCVS